MKRFILLFAFVLSTGLAVAQSYLPLYGFFTASGTDTYTATVTPTPAYQNGLTVKVKFTNANTGASTINLNSLGAKSVTKKDGSALSAGDISAGQLAVLVYDGTKFQIIGDGGAGGGGGTWGSITGTLSSQTDLQTALDDKWSLTSGGTLTGNNQIDGAGTYSIQFQNPTSFDVSASSSVGILSNNTDVDALTTLSLGGTDASTINFGNATSTTAILGTVGYTADTPNQFTLSGTWTATGNNNYLAGFGGTLTARTTAADFLHGYWFNPSLTGGATSQQDILGVTIQPTLTGGADNTDRGAALYVNPTFAGTLQSSYGIASVGSSSTSFNGLRVMNTSTGTAFIDFVAASGSVLGSSSQAYIERSNGANGLLTIANTGTGNMLFATNGSNRLSISGTSGAVTHTQSAQASGWTAAFTQTPGAHTGLTAATEFISRDFAGASQQWLAGTVATQRFNYFRGYTVTGASATATFTDIYNVYIDANTASTNATFTRSHALGLGGNLRIPADASATNGRIYLGAGNDNFTTAAITIANTAGLAAFQNWSAYSNNGSSEFRVGSNTATGLDFTHFNGTTSAATLARSFIRVREGLTSSTAGVSYTSFSVIPIWNTTGSFNGTLIGYDYNPTRTSVTGATELAIRTAGGQVLIANSSSDVVTASTRLDVRGVSGGDVFRLASDANSTLMTVSNTGVLSITSTNPSITMSGTSGVITVSANSTMTFRSNYSTTASSPVFRFNNVNTSYTPGSGTLSEIGATGSTFGNNTGTAVFNQILLNNTVNTVGQMTWINSSPTITNAVNITGYDWNPTTPTNVTGIHLAIRATAGGQAWDGKTTPTQITANQNDYNPTGLNRNYHIRLSSDASRDITGIVKGVDGQMFILHNVGSFNIVLKDESASSTAANRFALNADVTIAPDQSVSIWYDSTSSRWRVIN